MGLKDRVTKFKDWLSVEDEDYQDDYSESSEVVTPPFSETDRSSHEVPETNVSRPSPISYMKSESDPQLHVPSRSEDKTVIDIRFPKRYENAKEIVHLLTQNASVLIDFQHLSDAQARRCLDYLDGARSVLNGDLRKVSNTIWLLAPANVLINMEDIRVTGLQADFMGEGQALGSSEGKSDVGSGFDR